MKKAIVNGNLCSLDCPHLKSFRNSYNYKCNWDKNHPYDLQNHESQFPMRSVHCLFMPAIKCYHHQDDACLGAQELTNKEMEFLKQRR